MGDLEHVSAVTCEAEEAPACPASRTLHSPGHAVQLPCIDAQALGRVDGWRRPRPPAQQAGCAFRLDQRGIFGEVLRLCERVEGCFFW